MAAFLSIEEVCKRYDLSRRQVMRLVAQGAFPDALKVNQRTIRFDPAAVRKWEEDHWVRGEESSSTPEPEPLRTQDPLPVGGDDPPSDSAGRHESR